MKKEKQKIKKATRKEVKIPKNIKKGHKKHYEQEDEEFDDINSQGDIYDSDEDPSFTQSFDEENKSNLSQNLDDSFEKFEKQIQIQLRGQKKQNISANENKSKALLVNEFPIMQEVDEKMVAIEENRKKLEELQKIRLQKYLKKPITNMNTVKTEEQQNCKIKLESQEASSVVPQPSQNGIQRDPSQIASSFTYKMHDKKDFSDKKLIKSNDQPRDPDFFNYLVKIVDGTITPQQLQQRKKQQQKKQKIEDKVKEILQKRKIQVKTKQQFDSKTQSEIKVLSTNMDSTYEIQSIDSFRMPLKSEILGKSQTNREDDQNNKGGRKKRTRVTPQMLKNIIKIFEIMARQQNGIIHPNENKLTFKDIGKRFTLGRSSVMKMYSDYCKDPTMKSRFDSKMPIAHNRTMMELTKRRITFVQKLIRKDCTLSQRQIAAQMNQHNDLKCKRKKRPQQTAEEYLNDPYHPIAYKAVSRLMKLGNFTRKKVTLIPKNRNSERTIQERYHYCQIVNELIADQNNKLFYLDECRFNLFTSRDWGWAPKGQLATKVRHNSKGKDVMLLAIIGKQGLIGYQVSDSYNRGQFTTAIRKLILKIIPEVVPVGQKFYLILDNCPIHNKECLKQLEQELPITVLYLPPYSPMLNPIQSWFGQLKRIVKSKIYKNRLSMRSEIIRVLQTFKQKSMEHYYRGIVKYVALGLKKQLYRGNNKF